MSGEVVVIGIRYMTPVIRQIITDSIKATIASQTIAGLNAGIGYATDKTKKMFGGGDVWQWWVIILLLVLFIFWYINDKLMAKHKINVKSSV